MHTSLSSTVTEVPAVGGKTRLRSHDDQVKPNLKMMKVIM